MKNVDVLVIGGGPGGTPAAMALASAGRRVLLVERGAGLGGTCLFEGCIPSKILRESAQRLRAIKRAEEFGLQLPAGEANRAAAADADHQPRGRRGRESADDHRAELLHHQSGHDRRPSRTLPAPGPASETLHNLRSSPTFGP